MSCSTHGDESHQLAKNGQEWNSSEGQKTSRGMEDSGTGSTRAFEGGSRSRKTTTVGLPGTPEERTKLRHKPSTMERYLDDQYEHWVQSPPPSTFSQSPMDPNLTRPSRHRVHSQASELTSSKTSGGPIPWSHHGRKISMSQGHDTSDSEEEKKGPFMAKLSFADKKGSSNRRKRRRVVEKSGDPNIQYKNISQRRRRYLDDFYTTLVDSSWMESLVLFAASFYISWVLFAAVYYVICYANGDFEYDTFGNHTYCVLEIENFASCFLFSLETQHTIGYGSRQTTNECTSAMIAMSLQSILGCLIQAFMVGLVFAKLSRPQSRSKTVVFSKHAVICERNHKLCIIFRVGDMRSDSFIVNASLSVKVIRRKVTDEGEMYHDVVPLTIKPDSAEEPCVFLIWPISAIHIIDKTSPFYKMNASDLVSDNFELHMVLEGTIESTSNTFQARTSYLPHEILWGHRFEPMMLYRRDHNKYQVNFSAFNSTYEVDTPIISAYELEHYYKRTVGKLSTISHGLPVHMAFQANPAASNANAAGGGDTSSETESEAGSKIP